MMLSPEARLFFGLVAGLSLVHMILRMIRTRSVVDFQLFIVMALVTALYFMEIFFLNLPLVDLILAITIGVTTGLYILRFLRFKK